MYRFRHSHMFCNNFVFSDFTQVRHIFTFACTVFRFILSRFRVVFVTCWFFVTILCFPILHTLVFFTFTCTIFRDISSRFRDVFMPFLCYFRHVQIFYAHSVFSDFTHFGNNAHNIIYNSKILINNLPYDLYRKNISNIFLSTYFYINSS